jgi:hypothetical protein
MIIYRGLAMMIWFGVMFAVCTAIITVLGAVVFGLASPSRTPRSALQALAANTRAGIAHVGALRPHGQNQGSR